MRAAGADQRECRLDAEAHFVEFLVQVDPNRLKDASRGVFVRIGSRLRLRDQRGQVAGAQNRRDGASLDDRARDPAGIFFLTELEEHRHEFGFARGVDPLRRRNAGGLVHAHVQWTVGAKAHAALTVVELWRGHAQVHQHANDFAEVDFPRQPDHFADSTMANQHASVVVGECTRELNRRRDPDRLREFSRWETVPAAARACDHRDRTWRLCSFRVDPSAVHR